jgi:hypothetical protein
VWAREMQLASIIYNKLVYEHQTLLQTTPTTRADCFGNYTGASAVLMDVHT